MLVFIDDSGDPGFRVNKGSSKVFVIALVIFQDELRVYLSTQLDNKSNDIFTDLKFVDSRQNTLIQLADMVAGCINESVAKGSSRYLQILQQTKKIADIWSFK